MRFAAVILLCVQTALCSPDGKRGAEKRGGSRQPVQSSECSDVPAHPFDLILGRPTHDSVTLSVLAYEDAEGSVYYGTQPDCATAQTPLRLFKKDEPTELVIGPLNPNTQYHYRFRCGATNSAPATFHTQRPPGDAFTFTVTADSHLDENTDAQLYTQTLANALADGPDFHIDLGDTFMTEKHVSRDDAHKQYLAQRYFFGQLCHSAPLFLVLGNHDGESPRGREDESDTLAAWSCLTRKALFPNPTPDGFYTGNTTLHPEVGLLQDYYAWEWGDALFIVLDPFWFTQSQRGQRNNWNRSLGSAQYLWLKRTLEASHARFKFVFIHHLVGGSDEQARGGAEAVPFCEWGGRNLDGSDGFSKNRSGWAMPIHQLLVQNHVNLVFHGHDHFFAKQEIDGIVYQLVPQPGCPGEGSAGHAKAYSYTSGVACPGAGYLRVAVSHDKIGVDYVRTLKSGDGRTAKRSIEMQYSVFRQD